MTKNVKINRQKLNRFLDSLKVRTSEELNERKRIGEEYVYVENNYYSIKEEAARVVLSNRPSRLARESCLPFKTQSKSTLSNKEEKPKYILASKYPLPMYPMQYKPPQKCSNASRLLNLSKLRPQRSRSVSSAVVRKEAPRKTLPGFNVEKVDANVF